MKSVLLWLQRIVLNSKDTGYLILYMRISIMWHIVVLVVEEQSWFHMTIIDIEQKRTYMMIFRIVIVGRKWR